MRPSYLIGNSVFDSVLTLNSGIVILFNSMIGRRHSFVSTANLTRLISADSYIVLSTYSALAAECRVLSTDSFERSWNYCRTFQN